MDVNLIVGIIVALVALWAVLLVLFWALRPKGVPVREIVRLIPDVLRLLRSLIGDRSAPLDVRFVLVGLVAWILSPIDLIPEFIPVLGPLDDVVVAVVAMRYVRRRVGVEDLRARWAGTPDGFALLLRVIGSG
ncbi:MAG: DUF1232 domain-containing protein [Chloroflexi bacterium]|nr:DUF1232 domain-containing protein [Chloroflexota bacterium]